jgi:hypothetical protein
MTIEELASSDMPLCEPQIADDRQSRFQTTNPGFYLRTRAERGDMPKDFISSLDELYEKGLEGVVAKERRYWFRQAKRLLILAGPTDPRQVRILRDAWARHQRLLEGPPITSRGQVDFPALLGIKHFDPTSIAYALKVHHEIENVLRTDVLPTKDNLHDYLGNRFPTMAEIRRLKMVMCWDGPAIFFAEDYPCDDKHLARVLTQLDDTMITSEGTSGLPCGVIAVSNDLRLRMDEYHHEEE